MKRLAVILLLLACAFAQNTTGLYVISGADYSGGLEGDYALLDINYQINIMGNEWTDVELFGGAIPVLESNKPLGYENGVLHYYTNTPGTQTLNVKVKVPLVKSGDRDIATLQIPHSTSTTIEFWTSDTTKTLSLEGGQDERTETETGKLTLYGRLSPEAKVLRLMVSRFKGIDDDKLPVVYADASQTTTVKDASLHTDYNVAYSILHKGISKFSVLIPADETVTDVSMRSLKNWREERVGEQKRVVVELSEERMGAPILTIKTEKNTEGETFTVNVPRIIVEGVARQQGMVALNSDSNAEIQEAAMNGLTRIDATEFTQRTAQPILLAYKYFNEPWSLDVSVSRHSEIPVLTATIDAATITKVIAKDGKSITRLAYSVKNNKKQFLKITLQGDATVWSAFVDGKAVKPSRNGNELLVPLIRSREYGEGVMAFPVEVIYITDSESGYLPIGTIGAEVPAVDIPVSQVELRFYVPRDYSMLTYWGGMEKGSISYSSPRYYEEEIDGRITGMIAPSPEMNAAAMGAVIFDSAQETETFAETVEKVMEEGVMPVKVLVPADGNAFVFKRVLAAPGEGTDQTVIYMHGIGFAIAHWLTAIILACLLYKAFGKKKIEWKMFGGAIAFAVIASWLLPILSSVTTSAMIVGTIAAIIYQSYLRRGFPRLGRKKKE